MLSQLFKEEECGFKRKFAKKYDSWKRDENANHITTSEVANAKPAGFFAPKQFGTPVQIDQLCCVCNKPQVAQIIPIDRMHQFYFHSFIFCWTNFFVFVCQSDIINLIKF